MSIPPIIKMKYVKNLAGSTGAKEYVNEANKHWVVKRGSKGYGGVAQVVAEATANDIYEAVGVPVPKHELEEKEDEKALKLEFIQGLTFGQIKDKKALASVKEELQKGFIIDALLANWDVIGLNRDNILVPADGSPPVRIDNGGTFTFRASGKPKEFGLKVTELETMRDPIKAPQAAAVFGSLSDGDVHAQIMKIVKPNYDTILSLTSDHIKDTMKARMDHLISIIHAPNYGFGPNKESFPAVTKQATDNPLLWSNWLSKLKMMLDLPMDFTKKMIQKNPSHTPSQVALFDNILNHLATLSKIQTDFYKLSYPMYILSDLEGIPNNTIEKKSFEVLYHEMDDTLANLSKEYTTYHETYGGIESWGVILKKVGPPSDEAANSADNRNYNNQRYHHQIHQQYEQEKQQYEYQFLVTVLEAAETSIKEALSKNPNGNQSHMLIDLEHQVDTTKKKIQVYLQQEYHPKKFTYEIDIDLGKTYQLYKTYNGIYKDLPKWDKLVRNMPNSQHVEHSESGLKPQYIVSIILSCTKKIAQFDEKHSILPTKKEKKAIDYLIAESKASLSLCRGDQYDCEDGLHDLQTLYDGVVHSMLYHMIKAYDRSNKKNEVLTRNETQITITGHAQQLMKYINQLNDTNELKRLYMQFQRLHYLDTDQYPPFEIQTLLENFSIQKLAHNIDMVKGMIPPFKPAAAPMAQSNTIMPVMMTQVQTQIQPDPRHTVKLDKKDMETHKHIANELIENNARIMSTGVNALQLVNEADNMFIRFYTKSGFSVVNYFLLGSVGRPHTLEKSSLVYKLLQTVFPSNSDELPADYEQRLIYYYMVNIYNAIQKGPVLHTNLYIKLYRGTNRWYLKENTDAWQYTNTFTSTSMKPHVTQKFTRSGKQYIFYVHPACRYMNISKMSRYPQEQEVVLTPYHRCLFIEKGTEYQKFLVVPTNLDIPNTYEMFLPWQSTVVNLSNQKEGGRVAIGAVNSLALVPGNITNMLVQNQVKGRKSQKNLKGVKRWNTRKNRPIQTKHNKIQKKHHPTIQNKKIPIVKANHTLKANTRGPNNHVVTASDGFHQRMATPITTIPGKPLTKEERDYVDAISKIIRADKVL